MQEEIEYKTVNFAISTTKLTARTFLKGAQFLLRQYDKNASQGKQSMKRLIRQNRGVTNVEIEKTGIKGFAKYAKRYHIDYAVQKDISCTPPRYMVYFKAQDTDALSAAFKEYSASVLNKTKRPSVLAKLQELVQAVAAIPDKVRNKDQELGLCKRIFPSCWLCICPTFCWDLRQRISVRHDGWLKAKRWEIRFCL